MQADAWRANVHVPRGCAQLSNSTHDYDRKSEHRPRRNPEIIPSHTRDNRVISA
jgi:hypothetical protein